MSDVRITATLCPKKLTFESDNSAEVKTEVSISLDENSTKASAIVPLKHNTETGVNDCTSPHTSIIVMLKDPNISEVDLIECLWGQGELSWVRPLGSFDKPHTAIDITWDNPIDNCAGCFWVFSYIAAHNPYQLYTRYPFIVKSSRVSVLGEIPANNVEDDLTTPEDETSLWMADVPNTGFSQETQPNVCPGERIELYWRMKINGQEYNALIDNSWFDTPMVAGGKIVGVSDEGTVDQKWVIEIYGVEVPNILPTDFAQYDVGSWVYTLKECAEGKMYGRTQPYSIDPGSAVVRAAPFDFSGGKLEAKPSGNFETKDFDVSQNFEDFELTYHEGVINDVNTDTNTADVTVTIVSSDGTTIQDFSDVAIFYHCPDSSDTNSGSGAFEEDDDVIILNENTDGSSISASDLSIIGFKDKLKLCISSYLKIAGTDTVIIVELPSLQKATNIPLNTGGTATFPCSESDISVWLANYSTISSSSFTTTNHNSPETLIFPSSCETVEDITHFYQESPYALCREDKVTYACSIDQTWYGNTKQATKTGTRSEFQNSAEDYFKWTTDVTTVYPFGREGLTYVKKYTSSTNFGGEIYIAEEYSISSLGYEEYRWLKDSNFDGTVCEYPGSVSAFYAKDYTDIETYTHKTPFDDLQYDFSLNTEIFYNIEGNQPGDPCEIHSSYDIPTIDAAIAMGIKGDKTKAPYLLSWYIISFSKREKIQPCTTVDYGIVECNDSSPPPFSTKECETPVTYNPPLTEPGLEIYNEFVAFFGEAGEAESGDPMNLNPFSLSVATEIGIYVKEIATIDDVSIGTPVITFIG